MPPMTAADALDAAADLIGRVGWWRPNRGISSTEGATCAALAINHVTKTNGDYHPAFTALADHVAISERRVYDRVIEWNDAQESADKVIWTMRQVASDLRESS